jgi:hypothetical protein
MTTVGGVCAEVTVKVVEVETLIPELIPVATRMWVPGVTAKSVPVLVADAVPRPVVLPIAIGFPSSEALTESTKNPLLDAAAKV